MSQDQLSSGTWIVGFVACCILAALAMFFQVGQPAYVKAFASFVAATSVVCIIAITLNVVLDNEARKGLGGRTFAAAVIGGIVVFSTAFFMIEFVTDGL